MKLDPACKTNHVNQRVVEGNTSSVVDFLSGPLVVVSVFIAWSTKDRQLVDMSPCQSLVSRKRHRQFYCLASCYNLMLHPYPSVSDLSISLSFPLPPSLPPPQVADSTGRASHGGGGEGESGAEAEG